MAITSLSSPLITIANKVTTRSPNNGNSLVKAQSEYKRFGEFLDIKTTELGRVSLPDNRQIQKLTSINVVNTFGSAGGLLGGLLGGSLDLGGLIRGFFPEKGEKIGSKPKEVKSSVKPSLKGERLRIGGIRALGVTNALFAGLDFTTGLAGGESIGKSAAGTSGSLAGSLLGGAIGQSLIPIPGVGFILGSAAGGFLGGYGADRAYDKIATQRELKAQQEAKLREQSQATTKGGKVDKGDDILSKFDDIANKFQGFVSGIIGGVAGLFGITEDGDGETNLEGNSKDIDLKGSQPTGVELGDYTVEGGETPGKPNSPFGMRHGKMHKGNDYFKNPTNLSAIQPGIVEVADMNYNPGGWGAVVAIRHNDGSKTLYAHMSQINVKAGQKIEAGTMIGISGGIAGARGAGNSEGPHLHFEYSPPGGSQVDPTNFAPKYFRFGGNVKVKPKAGGQATAAGASTAMVQTGVKPGQITSTAFGQQGSTNIVNYGAATKTNIKGFIIVPGHIAGGGASGEIAATQKIAKNIVDKLQKKYPGVPIQFWNHRNYKQTIPGFTKEMNDLKKLESQGWEIIEIHMDASIESGEGKGRGVIVPFGGKNLNEFDTRFAAQKGSYPSTHRGGLGATNRGMTIVETGNIGPQALSGLNKGDQSAVDFFSSDTIQILEQLIKEGKIGGGYRQPQSQVTTPQSKPKEVSYMFPHKTQGRPTTLMINPTIIATGDNQTTPQTEVPTQINGGGGGSTVVASSNSATVFDEIYRLYLQSKLT